MPFNFFHLMYRVPSYQLSVNDFAKFFNRFSCFLLNFAESRSSCFQFIISVIDFCPQLVEGFFTATRNTLVVIWERFHPSRNCHLHGMTTFDVKDNLFVFLSMKCGGRFILLPIHFINTFLLTTLQKGFLDFATLSASSNLST